jgi:hypothetical protein
MGHRGGLLHQISLTLLAAALASSGCGANYYGTMLSGRAPIARSVLDELGGAKRFGVTPLSFEKVRFRSSDKELTEDQAFEGKRAEKRASWDEDKKAMIEAFGTSFGTAEMPFELAQVANVEAAKDADFVIVPEAVLVDPGYFATLLFNENALLVVRYDVIRVSDKKSVFGWSEREESNRGAASGTRLRAAAVQAGMGGFLTLRAMAKPILAQFSSAAPAKEAP